MCDSCPEEYEYKDNWKINKLGKCEGYCCNCLRYWNNKCSQKRNKRVM